MSRSLLSSLALSVLFLAGCPSPSDKPADDTAPDDDSTTCFDEDGDGYCESEGDCDPNDPAVNPAAEDICDGNDNNCNGEIDENGDTVYYLDSDNDGFGDRDMSLTACEPDSGYVANADDCNDSDSSIFPDAPETCDGLDNDCDGDIDEDLTTTYYMDADGDGYGDPSNSIDSCTGGEDWVTNSDDCNDGEAMAYNGAAEVCDGIDNDCNGVVDDDMSQTWYPDVDGDGYGDDSAAYESCLDSGDILTGGDCNDAEPLAYTGAAEVCDEVDNDCNGLVDDDAVDATAQIADDDNDGFGSATATTYACDALVDNTLDCDDSDAGNPQVVDDSGSSTSADGTISNPWPNIQDGIDNATECVAVQSGVYYENIDFNGSDVSVFSVSGWASTIIDGGGAGSVVTFDSNETAAAELDGFTIQNGGGHLDSYVEVVSESSSSYTITYNRYYGGGVFSDSASPTLMNLWITSNELPDYSYTVSGSDQTYVYSYGGGVFADNGTPTLTNVTADWNSADQGGGVYVSEGGSVSFASGRLNYNSASGGGGFVTTGTFNLTNAIVAGNDASTVGGGGYIDGGSSTWWNVSAVANSSPMGAGVAVANYGSFYFYSSSISTSVTGEGVYGDSGVSFGAEYSNVYGSDGADFSGVTDPTGTAGNISANPSFTSWTDDNTDNDDLSLAAGSTLINAGNPSSAYNDIDGTRNDIGAYGGPGGNW